jgi:hypothetical protein
VQQFAARFAVPERVIITVMWRLREGVCQQVGSGTSRKQRPLLRLLRMSPPTRPGP